MRKKFYLLLTTLLLFAGGVKAQSQLTVYDGTNTSACFPFYVLFCDYSTTTLSQWIVPASDITAMNGGNIQSVTFHLSRTVNSSTNTNWQLYVMETTATTFTGAMDYSGATKVYEGAIDITQNTLTITFSTPFPYHGGNLFFCGRNVAAGSYKIVNYYGEDGHTNASYCSNHFGSHTQDFLPKTTFTYVPAPLEMTPVAFGDRPNNAWMEPVAVELSGVYNITAMDVDNDYFAFEGQTVPFTTPANFTVTTGNATAGEVIGNVSFMYNGSKSLKTFEISATAYDPANGDVYEKATVISDPTEYTDTPDFDGIYHNYNLPGEGENGKDAVYKMTLANDIMLTAGVSKVGHVNQTADNAKLALYTQDFNGEGGPMAHNNYTYNGPTGERGNCASDLINEGFEGGSIPAGWNTTASGYSVASSKGGKNACTGNYSLFFYDPTDYSMQAYDIKFPTVDLTEATGGTLSFNIVNPTGGWGIANPVYLYVSLDGGAATLVELISYNTTAIANWTQKSYDLTDYLGHTVQFKFIINNFFGVTGIDDVKLSADLGPVDPEYIIEDLYVPAGTYYLVGAATEAFQLNMVAEAAPAPEAAVINYPTDGMVGVESPCNANWTLKDYTTEMQVKFGSTYPPAVVVDWTSDLFEEMTFEDLASNTTYFLQVNVRNASGVTEGEIVGFTTELSVPMNVAIETSMLYPGDAAQLSWEMNRSFRGYNVYVDGERWNEEIILEDEYAVEGLPYGTHTLNVTAVYDEGESGYSNGVDVYMTGFGHVAGTVYEMDATTPVAGAEVYFEGEDAFGAVQTFLFTTAADGTFAGDVLEGEYVGYAFLDGYQLTDARNFEIAYNYTTEGIIFYLREEFIPVGQVYSEVTEDDKANVWWSMTPANLIEDFEEGVMPEGWNQVGSYGWEITTNSPYEGTYCIKSSNAGVASSTGAVEITVEVPFNAEMSFFVKPSSESNYDKFYFYIDGAEKVNMSGAGSWGEKTFNVSQGTHTYKFAYTKDGSVNSNDDCIYVDYVTLYRQIEPEPPFAGGWIQYDDGTYSSSVGTGSAGSMVYWAVCWPNASAYNGCTMTKAALYDAYAGAYTITVYEGGDAAPQTAIGTTTINGTGSSAMAEATFATPIAIDGTKPLWIVGSCSTLAYPMPGCNNTGDPNGRWVSLDGTTWEDIASYGLSYTWMMRGYVQSAKGEMIVLDGAERAPQNIVRPEITVERGTPSTGTFMAKVAETPVYVGVPTVTRGGNGTRSFQNYKVYRRNVLDGTDPTLITTTGDTCYIDNAWSALNVGVYQYGVSATYDGNRGNRATTLLTEGFESGIPSTWSQEGSGMMWYQNGEYSVPQGNYAARVDCDWNGNYSRYLVTPALDFSDAASAKLTFKAHQHMQSWKGNTPQYGPDPINIYYRTSSTGSWTLIQTIAEGNSTYGNYNAHEINIPAGAFVATAQIAFRNGYADGYGSFIDDVVITKEVGVLPPTGVGESEITWAEPMDKNMEVTVDLTAVTNNGQSVAGAVVTFANNVEEDVVYEETLDETGFVSFDEFRCGYYTLTVNLPGYSSSVGGDVEIFEDKTYNAILSEIVAPAEDLWVSQTGWVMWENIIRDRAAQYSIVKLNGMMVGQPTTNYYQLDETTLVDGVEYTVEVASMYASGLSEWRTATFTYRPSDPYYKTGVKNFAAQASNTTVTLSWELPGGGGVGDEFFFDFEDGFQGWTSIDGDGDGYGWKQASTVMTGVYGHNNSADFVFSQSYDNSYGVLYPNNFLVSPQQYHIGGSSVFSFYACAQDASYAAEHFGVAISTTGNTSANDFTTIVEWTMTAKDGAKGVRGTNAQGTWYEYTCDLSEYAGEDVWIAVRHFNCSDMFYIDCDDFALTNAEKGDREMWDLVASFSCNGAGEQGIATDGEFIYTSSWSGNPGYDFGKYDLEGNQIETFNISGATGVRDLTYDGTYFYGSSGSSAIYILDMANKTKVGQINTSATTRHLSYDPVRDAFWTGNWSDLYLFDRNGTKLLTGPAPSSAYGTGYFQTEDGEEHLYMFCQPSSDAKVYDYNITTNTLGSSPIFDFANTPGFNAGISGGSFIGQYGDKICWFGNAQQDPNLVGIYELAEAETPLEGGFLGAYIFRDGELITPEPLTTKNMVDENVAEGEHEYMARLVYGDAELMTLDTTWYAMSIPVTVTVNVEIECTPVDELEGEAVYNEDGTYGVQLEWICTGANVQSYKVYRNNQYIATTTTMSYYDERTNNPGEYTYGVVAVYDYCEAEMVTVSVSVDAIEENSVIEGMYPNPTTGVININATAMQQIVIVNALGQTVMNAEVSGDQTSVDMSSFGAGVYMVTVRTENGTSVQRVTVIR